tara:strand:+ start:406 stop:2151 length:1746 start_codon:yes stop_codon:yes gene_type:complete
MKSNLIKSENIQNIILFSLSIYFLYPLLNSGYISDDAYNSLIRGSMLEKNITFFQYLIELNWGWLNGSGRLYPIEHISQTFLFYFVDNLVIFKLIKLLVIVFSIYYFKKYINILTNSNEIGNLVFLTLIIFFQFRQWHDPILGFAILIPLICLFLFSSLYYFQLYLNNKNRKNLIKSLLLYICLILTYEISYLLIIIFFITAYYKSNSIKLSIYETKYYLFILFSALIITIYFRLTIDGAGYPSIDKNLSIINFLKAFFIQIISGLSFSYFVRLKIDYFQNLEIIDLFIIFYFIIYCKLLINLKKLSLDNKSIILIFIIGLMIIFTQSFMVAISGHKTDVIKMGIGFGYLPVLIQYFGFTLIYISIFLFVTNKFQNQLFLKLFTIIICILISLNGLINLTNNRYVVHETNKFYKYPREILKKALKNVSSNDLIKSEIIIRNWRYPHDINWFYAKHKNKLFCIVNYKKNINSSEFSWPTDCAKKQIELKNKYLDINNKDYIYAISYNFDPSGKKKGIFFMARILDIKFNQENKISKLLFKNLLIFNEEKEDFEHLNLDKYEDFLDILNQDNKLPEDVYLSYL